MDTRVNAVEGTRVLMPLPSKIKIVKPFEG